MKREQVFPSNFLAKDDVATPIVATIEDIRLESVTNKDGGPGAKKNKPVLHFQDDQLGPLILNLVNWSVLEDAYGPDSVAWTGRNVEVYLDQSVMFGGRRVGGVRVRIPVAQPAAPAQPGPRAAAPPVQPPAQAPKAQPSLEERHKQILTGIAGAPTLAKLAEWARWSKTFAFTEGQEDGIGDAYHDRQAELQQAPARQTVRAGA